MGENSFQLFPEAASSIAGQVDGLYAYLVLVSAFFSLLIAFLVVFFAVKYRRRKNDEIPKPMDEHSIGGMVLEIVWSIIPLGLSHDYVRVGRKYFLHGIAPTSRLDGNLRHRQAVDVEGPAQRRRAGNQRTACTGESRHPAHFDFRRCDPRLFRARVPDENRRASGPLYNGVVSSHQSWRLSHLLHGILRHEAFRDQIGKSSM